MAFLKKKDLQNGILSYRRQKPGSSSPLNGRNPCEIIDKYDIAGHSYLLPIIKNMEVDARRQYKNAAHLVNDKLRKLGEQLGLAIPLTTYVARHGWASIARSKNIPLPIISEAMGHDSEKRPRASISLRWILLPLIRQTDRYSRLCNYYDRMNFNFGLIQPNK